MSSTPTPREQPSGLTQRLRYRNWRIAVKLLVVILMVALLPLLLATWISSQNSTNALTEQTRVSLARLAHTVALRVSQLLASSHEAMGLAASDPQVVAFLGSPPDQRPPELKADLNAAVASLLATVPAIDVVGIYDAQGTTVAHSDPSTVGRNVFARDFVQAALAGRRFTSNFRRDPVTDTPGINISTPVRDGDQIVGAIAMHIKGNVIDDVLARSLTVEGVPDTTAEQAAIDVFLVDGHGIVVSSPKEPGLLYRSLGELSQETVSTVATDQPLGLGCKSGAADCAVQEKAARVPAPIRGAQPLGEHLAGALRAGDSGSYRFCDPANPEAAWVPDRCDGSWHVVGYAPVPALSGSGADTAAAPLLVAVDVPEETFLAPVSTQRLQGFAIAGIIALIAAGAALFLARSLARPIAHLASVASQVEHDHPFAPNQLGGVSMLGDEIGHLARVFSSMVVALRNRMAELRSIYEIGRVITSSVDLDETLAFIITSLRTAIPYDAGEICLYDAGQQKMVARVAADGEQVRKVEQAYAPDEYFIARLAKQGTGLLLPDLRTSGPVESKPARTWQALNAQAYLGVPLLVKGEMIGTIELVSRHPGGLNQDNLNVLESVAIQAAAAIQNAQEVQQRENRLKQQIAALTIQIDEIKREKQVSEIVESDYFQRLRTQVAQLRQARRDKPDAPGA